MNTPEKIATLNTYNTSVMVLANFAPDYFQSMTEAQQNALEEQETNNGEYLYTVMNGKTVVFSDNISGDVYSVQTVEELVEHTKAFFRENLPDDLPPYQASANKFCEAIQTIAERPEALDNLRHYLARHFPEWLRRFGKYPEDFVFDFNEFATIQF